MLAHAPHRHNPDARIGDEDLIRGQHSRRASGARPRRRCPARRTRAARCRASRRPRRSDRRRGVSDLADRARRTHCSWRPRSRARRASSSSASKAPAAAASAAASTFSSRLRCLMPASAGLSASAQRRHAQRDAFAQRDAGSAASATATRGGARDSVPCGRVTAAQRAAARDDDLEHRQRWRQRQRRRDLGAQVAPSR